MEKIATRESYGETLRKLGATNHDIVVLDADLSKSTKTEVFARAFPERFFDMGIAEQDLMGTAAGLALSGKIPFVSTFAVFATGRAYDQVRNSIAYPKLNVKIVATHAGITVGEDGASHQAVEDIALMRAMPNMKVIVPADAVETARAVETAVTWEGPVYIRLGRIAVPVLFEEDYDFVPGQATRLRTGTEAAVLATGIMVGKALEAAEILAGQSVHISVFNVSTIKPMDVEAVVEAARQTGALVTAEEHSLIGGLGSAVAEILSSSYPVPLERVALPDAFGESGGAEELLVKYGLTAQAIVDAVERVRSRRKSE